MRFLFLIAFLTLASLCQAQDVTALQQIQPPADYENIHVEELYSDTNASGYLIWVKERVKVHKHLAHTEVVYILEGSGDMLLGKEKKSVMPGDVVFVPQGTLHGVTVTSAVPMKVLSIQTPQFFGKDRVFEEEE